MRNITSKIETLRTAKAAATLHAPKNINELLKASLADKGNALEISRVAGIMAAKKTWETIPFCHQIPMTHVEITFEVKGESIEIFASCTTIAATGCEVEAMTAVSISALTLYDMLKPHTAQIRISDIHLLSKKGGKSDRQKRLDPPVKVAILVTSNAVLSEKKQDTAGQIVLEHMKNASGIVVQKYEILGDNYEEIGARISDFVANNIDLILTVGGTGLVHSDVTVKVVASKLDKEIPGIMEAGRSYGQRRTPVAMISRGIAGLIEKSLIITLPGSTKGARQTIDALFPSVLRIVKGQRK